MSSADPTNGYSEKHPHEPDIAPVFDPEGRCLVCGCQWRDEQIESIKAENERLRALLTTGRTILRTTYGSKESFSYVAKEWVLKVEAELRGRD